MDPTAILYFFTGTGTFGYLYRQKTRRMNIFKEAHTFAETTPMTVRLSVSNTTGSFSVLS
jgi:hypothetical protein